MKKKHNNAVGPQVRIPIKSKFKKKTALLTGVSLIAGLQGATQYFAHTFQYQEALGLNVDHVYPPWSIFSWSSQWGDVYWQQIQTAGSVGILIGTVGLIATLIASTIKSRTGKANEYLHGSARWSGYDDIQKAGLLPAKRSLLQRIRGVGSKNDGVYVGGWIKEGEFVYLKHTGPEHVLTYAPTRSGKGVGLVIPTLLSWPHSCLITDLKGELWEMTAGWRKEHAKNKVIRFEPASLNGSAKWNPLDEIRIGTEYEVGDAQNLAILLMDPQGKGLQDHWQKTSFALVVGVILHVLYKSRQENTPANLSTLDAFLSNPKQSAQERWEEMATYAHINGETHIAIGAAARDMLDRPEEEEGSVLSSAKTELSLFRDPVVAHNTSTSDFKIKDLMNDEDPVSLYIVTQPTDKNRLKPLVRIMLNMSLRLLADKMEFERIEKELNWKQKLLKKLGFSVMLHSMVKTKKTYKHRLLGMIDEFPSLGKLEILQESLAFVAGYGIKFYLICQDINQLKSREQGYGPDETITSNCHVQNAYPPNRLETAEHLSKLCGQTTVVKEQITASGKRFSALLGQVSTVMQEVQRPLLTTDECIRMPGPVKTADGLISEAGDMVVYVAGFPAIYGKQPLFFQDEVFNARASVPAPEKSDVIRSQLPIHTFTL